MSETVSLSAASLSILLPLALFVVAMVGSPGPANVALMGAGAAAGLRGALPFFVGVLSGFAGLATVLAFGLADLLVRFPILARTLTLFGTVYLGWLAWKLWTARPTTAAGPGSAPGFLAGLVVHPLNPKAWAMLVAAFGQFVSPGPQAAEQSMIVIATFVLLGAPLNLAWCAGGAALSRLLQDGRRAVILNRVLAVLLVVSVAWALLR